MKLLGIDYGLKRIGLAISAGELAEPLGQVGDIGSVARIAGDHAVEKIVIGLPDPRNPKIKLFGQRLNELTGIPVQYFDETFSTRQARAKMIAAGTSPRDRRSAIDQNAAAVILQSYLDSRPEGVPL